MRVLQVTPYSLETNPYMRLLMSALEDADIDIRVAVGRSPVLLWKDVVRHGLPDLVHLQWHHRYFTADTLPGAVFRTTLFFIQWLTLRLLGVRFAWTVHNILDHERRQNRWELFACRRWARRVDAIVVHCDEALELVRDAYRTDRAIHVVPHGRFPATGPRPDRASARADLELPEDSRVLLFFGRIRPYKGLESLLAAFEAVDDPAVRLLVMGFPDSEEFGRSIADRSAADPRVMARLAFIDDATLDRYLAAADLVVLPYRDLLTSGAAILAASRGRPVLVPDLACLRAFPDDAALRFEPGDVDALAAALRSALEAPLDEMGAAARRYIDQFSWARVADETVSVYKRALG